MDPCPTSSSLEEFDPYDSPSWVASSLPTMNSLNIVMPLDEDIIKAMVGFE